MSLVNAGLIIAAFSFTPNAHADLITYEISAVASGKIGGTTFTDALVELTGTGDTANVTSFVDTTDPMLMGDTIFTNPFSETTVTIAGVGTATITDPSEFFAVPAGGAILFGRTDKPPSLESITGLGLLISNAAVGYEGATAIGPITDSGAIGFPGCGGLGEDPCVGTTLGFLSFNSNLSLTPNTEATFVATLQPVPEPTTTLFLLCSGAAALVAKSRLRTRHCGNRPGLRIFTSQRARRAADRN